MSFLLTKQLSTGVIRKQLLQDFAFVEQSYVAFFYFYIVVDFYCFSILPLTIISDKDTVFFILPMCFADIFF